MTIRLMIEEAKLNDEMRERLDRSWAVLEHAAMQEDWPMEVTIQENVNANPEGTFIYGRGKVSAQHPHRRLDEDMKNLGLLDRAAGTDVACFIKPGTGKAPPLSRFHS